jgi:hypothetical protein
MHVSHNFAILGPSECHKECSEAACHRFIGTVTLLAAYKPTDNLYTPVLYLGPPFNDSRLENYLSLVLVKEHLLETFIEITLTIISKTVDFLK